jgi:hypothetical protein
MKQRKIKSEHQQRELTDLLGLPPQMHFKANQHKLQQLPLCMVHLIQHRIMHRKQMQPLTPQLLLQQDGHQEGYVFTTQGRPPEGGHQELEPCLKSDIINMLVDYYSRSCPSNGCAMKSWTRLYMMP